MLDLMQYQDIYEKSLAKWGAEAQHDQAVEECAELIATLKHYRRNRVDEQVVANELADVFLMLGQLVYMIGEDRVKSAIALKIEKLNGLLKDG